MKNILLTIPTIVDADCDINLTTTQIKIYKNNKLILQGNRDDVSRMWTIDLPIATLTNPKLLNSSKIMALLAVLSPLSSTPRTNLEKLMALSPTIAIISTVLPTIITPGTKKKQSTWL